MKKRLPSVVLLITGLLAAGCGGGGGAAQAVPGGPIEGIADRKVKVTTTVNFISDLAEQIGGDRVEVSGLMGPGVDPHLYKPSAGDVERLSGADVVLYGGLELEGRMGDILVELASRRATVPVTRDIPRDDLLEPAEFDGKYDPHVWFDPRFWKIAAEAVADTYSSIDPDSADSYAERLETYSAELDELFEEATEQLEGVPESSRVLVTSHDAFNYFGEAFGWEVLAIQGISTATEATTSDIERIADLLAEREIKAVFVESSVPRQTIEAVLAAARDKGWDAEIGGELFSDAAGDADSEEGTYIGMLRHNVNTIVEALS